MNSNLTDFWKKVFSSELENFIVEIINDYPEYKDRILELIPEYCISIESNDLSYTNDDKCLARTFNNGQEKRCSQCKKKASDFCTRHMSKLLYGRITDPIPQEYADKFTKRLSFEKQNTNNEKIRCILNPVISNNSDKSALQEIILNENTYLYDEISQSIYTNNEKPIYIGQLVDNYIVR